MTPTRKANYRSTSTNSRRRSGSSTLRKGALRAPEVAHNPEYFPTSQLSMLRLVFDKQMVPPSNERREFPSLPVMYIKTFKFMEFTARPREGGYNEPWWIRCALM